MKIKYYSNINITFISAELGKSLYTGDKKVGQFAIEAGNKSLIEINNKYHEE